MKTLVCECGSQFFTMQEAKRYKEIAMSTGMGYEELSVDGWRVYMCVNCKKVQVPHMTTLSGVKRSELNEHSALVAAAEGKPIEIPETTVAPERKFIYG